MKFRYKVLMINIIVLSIAIGTIGFFMIYKNFNLALDSQIKTSIEDNNLIQSFIEYECLGQTNLRTTLPNIGKQVTSGMYMENTDIFIVYDNQVLFSTVESSCPEELFTESTIGKKNYVLTKEGGSNYIFVSSCSEVFGKKLHVVNRRDISSVYALMNSQRNYFNILLVIVLLVCSILMYIISMLLTKPLEHLQKTSESFAKGDYDARAHILSNDEVGELADTYNNMAQSVSEHITELKDMVTRQEQFVSDFTHEIKTPMTSIIGYSDTLRSMNLSKEDQIIAASYIFNEGKRLESMSMKLFDFIYTKHHPIKKDAINTKALMNSIAESVEPSYKNSELILEIHSDSGTIYGDKDLLKSAFINLLDNARKASQPNNKVIFSGEATSTSYIITVKDFGIGIEENHLSKICDEFYMVDKSRSRKEGGAGLGLSLAALIFKSHDSHLNIESTVGKGTTFSITFPAIEPNKKEESNEQ